MESENRIKVLNALKEAGTDPATDPFTAKYMLEEHIENLIRTGTLELFQWDMTHELQWLVDTYENRNKPRDYNFQEETANMDEAIRSFSYLFDTMFLGFKPDDVIKAINGEAPAQINCGSSGRCGDCDEPFVVVFKGNKFSIQGKNGKCKSSKNYTVDVRFPTGNVLFFDNAPGFFEAFDTRSVDQQFNNVCADGKKVTHELIEDLSRTPDGKYISVNNLKGTRLWSENFARHGIMRMFAGNSVPGVYVNRATDEIKIGESTKYVYDETHGDNDVHIESYNGFEDIGSICCDLWWVTMVDESVYRDIIAKVGVKFDEKEFKDKRGTIRPGTYRFTSHYRGENVDAKVTGVRIGD